MDRRGRAEWRDDSFWEVLLPAPPPPTHDHNEQNPNGNPRPRHLAHESFICRPHMHPNLACPSSARNALTTSPIHARRRVSTTALFSSPWRHAFGPWRPARGLARPGSLPGDVGWYLGAINGLSSLWNRRRTRTGPKTRSDGPPAIWALEPVFYHPEWIKGVS